MKIGDSVEAQGLDLHYCSNALEQAMQSFLSDSREPSRRECLTDSDLPSIDRKCHTSPLRV
jgi:hypothetical protein